MHLFLNVLLQPTKPFLGSLKNIVILADGKAKVIFSDAGIRVCVELGGRNSSNSYLLDKEPRKLEVSRTTGHVRGKGIVFGQPDR